MPVDTTVPSRQAVAEVQHLNVSLGGLPILRDIDFTILQGELTAVMGGNGSGKTTLMRAMLGVIPHQHGTIKLYGTPLASFRDWRRIGYVPQRSGPSLQQATVWEVVASGRLARRRPFLPCSAPDRKAIESALADVDMQSRTRDRFVDLSGGQQQRVLIARALAGEPDFILLDEPLAGVDIGTQDALAHVIASMNARGVTALLVVHELGPFADMLRRAIVLRAGRLISDGPVPAHAGTAHGHETTDPAHDHLIRGAMDEEH